MHFTAKEHDAETGLDNFGARYFGSGMGRFLSPDPSGISLANLSDPQQLNLYSYVRNNPLSLTDPTGLSDCPPFNNQGTEVNNEDCSSTSQTGSADPCPDGSPDGAICVTATGEKPADWSFLWDFANWNTTSLIGHAPNPHAGLPQTPTTNNLVPANPCAYSGRALTAYDYASAGKASSLFSHPINFALDVFKGFPTGDYLDAQPLASGNVLQNAAYGNYAFGVYMAAAHVPLSVALTGAAVFGLHHTYTSANGPRDPIFRNLPAANVANISNGFNAEKSGTLCHE